MTDPDLLPAYGSGSLAELLPSVSDGMRVPGCWDVLGLGEHDRVLVLVVDGLGAEQLAQNAAVAPQLAAWSRRRITSVFPSTTPAALTSIGTGLAPGEHGIVGASFRLPETGRVLWPLGWKQDPQPLLIQPRPTWWERAQHAGVTVHIVQPRGYQESGLSRCALRGGTSVGADGPGERIAAMVAAMTGPGRRLGYGYWEALDKAAHVHGTASQEYRYELAMVEWLVTRVAEALPAGTRLVITADHGVLDCPEGIGVDTDPSLVADVVVVAGEPRVRHVYTEPGRADLVAGRWRDRLGSAAEVLTREQAAGLFAPGDAAMYQDRIGDVVAIARGGVRLEAPSRDSVLSRLPGQHGALTVDEMAVPLAVVDR